MDIKRKVRDRRQPGFFTIDNEVYDLGLSCEALALYSAIARFANNSTESAYFSGKKWKKHHKVGHAKLSAAMRELTAHKLIFDTGEKTLVGASYFELCNIDHLKKQKGGEVFQGRTGGCAEAEQGGVLRQNTNETNKTKQENDTLSAADLIKSPFEQEKKKTKILKTEDKELSTSIYEILDKSKYTIEHSKTLTNKIAVAVRRHGLEALKKAVSSRIQYQASAGRDLYIHHFLADAPAIEWHIARSQTLPTPTKSNLPDFSHIQYDDAPFDEHAMDEFKVTHA